MPGMGTTVGPRRARTMAFAALRKCSVAALMRTLTSRPDPVALQRYAGLTGCWGGPSWLAHTRTRIAAVKAVTDHLDNGRCRPVDVVGPHQKNEGGKGCECRDGVIGPVGAGELLQVLSDELFGLFVGDSS